jgi:GT2 family glycosyltransferase
VHVSVIVALHRHTPEARQCLEQTLLQLRDGDELLVVSDQAIDGLPAGARALVTGSATDTSPAEKRDAGVAVATGAVCAFIDDDAYPADGWLRRAAEYFEEDPSLGALGGPGVSPPGGDLLVRLGGAFYESRLGSGGLRNRFVAIGERKPVDDWPAYNFFVRTAALRAVGGWGSKFYGGEDTKLCLDLHEAGYRIDYVPDVVVYHHRRPLFRPLIRQVGNVGRHRGFFVRRFPQTSKRPIYFAPTAALFAAPLIGLWALADRRRRRTAGVALMGGWAAVATVSRLDGAEPVVALLTPVALAAGHGGYGWGFARGITGDDIDEM